MQEIEAATSIAGSKISEENLRLQLIEVDFGILIHTDIPHRVGNEGQKPTRTPPNNR